VDWAAQFCNRLVDRSLGKTPGDRRTGVWATEPEFWAAPFRRLSEVEKYRGLVRWQANVPNQRRQITSNSAPAVLVRPLRWGCYTAFTRREVIF